MEGSESSGGEPWGGDSLSFLEPLGRITLTVYVLHFAVLGCRCICHARRVSTGAFSAFAITIGHTLVWIPLAKAQQEFIPEISLEGLLRKMNQSLR